MKGRIGRECKECGRNYMVSLDYPDPPTRCGPCLGSIATEPTEDHFTQYATDKGFGGRYIQSDLGIRLGDDTECPGCGEPIKVESSGGRPKIYCGSLACNRKRNAEKARRDYWKKKKKAAQLNLFGLA